MVLQYQGSHTKLHLQVKMFILFGTITNNDGYNVIMQIIIGLSPAICYSPIQHARAVYLLNNNAYHTQLEMRQLTNHPIEYIEELYEDIK